MRTGLRRQCHRAIGTTCIRVRYCNELTNSAEEITIHPIVVDHDIDIIMGKPTIFENELLVKLNDQVWSRYSGGKRRRAAAVMAMQSVDRSPNVADSESSTFGSTVAATYAKSLYFTDDDTKELEEVEQILDSMDLNQPIEGDVIDSADAEDVIPTNISGSWELKRRLRELCEKYRSIF